MSKKSTVLILLVFAATCSVFAQLRVPAWISSGMVLQQMDTTTLRGWGGPGSYVQVQTSWNNRVDSVKVSNLAAWTIRVPTPKAGGPYRITLRNGSERLILEDVLIGEVWLCSGQSNMEWSYRQGLKDIREELPVAFNPSIRFFHIPKTGADLPQENVQASWRICDSVSLKDFSAVGYFFGKRLHRELGVPVGLIDASWGGTPAEAWIPAELVTGDPILREASAKLNTFDWWPSAPGKAWNGMIAPLRGYALAGSIWYQGESNVGTAGSYKQLMVSLIDSWRRSWKKEFPFFYVQIAPYDYGEKSESALLREAQTDLLSYPKTGMVVVADLVDNIKDIHPVNKHDVGARLAGLALGDHYKVINRNYRSPLLESWFREKNRLILTFFGQESLVIRGKDLDGAVVAGADGIWYKASGKLENGKLVIWSKNVKEPIAARYAFGNTIIGNLFSAGGLPVVPFRTDR